MRQIVACRPPATGSLHSVGALCLLLGLAPRLGFGAVTFEASVDRSRLTLDDRLVLTLTVSGARLGRVEPKLPALPGFSILGRSTSQQVVFSNGRLSTTVQYNYTLSPLRPGKQTIPPASLSVGGRIYRTRPLTVTVTGGGTTQPHKPAQSGRPAQPAAPQGPAAPMPPGYSADHEQGYVFLKATVDKTTVYVNEQVTLDITAYRHRNYGWSGAQFSPPALTGFIGYDLPKPDPRYVDLNGVPYVRICCLRKALFPTAAGKLTLGASSLRFATDFFGTEVRRVTSHPLSVTVLPLPEADKPKQFTGAVGAFTLRADADKTSLPEGDTVTIHATVEGTGNIASVTELTLGDLSRFKQFKTNQREQTSTRGLKLSGTKDFEYVLMPVEPGRVTLSLKLFYFNPETKKYETAEAEPIVLNVLPGKANQKVDAVTGFTKEEIRLLKKDIHYIRPGARRLGDETRYLFCRPSFLVLNLAPLLLLGGAALYRRQQVRLATDEEYQRRRRGRDAALRCLSQAEQGLQRGLPAGEFYAELSRGLREYLGARLHLPPSAVSADTTPGELARRGVPAELVARLKECLQQSEFGRFAPGGADQLAMQKALTDAQQCIRELEGLEV